MEEEAVVLGIVCKTIANAAQPLQDNLAYYINNGMYL